MILPPSAEGTVLFVQPEPPKLVTNYNHWRPLHEYAINCANQTLEQRRAYVARWEATIPNSCGCAGSWKAMAFEWDYDNLFESSVNAHRKVTEKLMAEGQDIEPIDLEQARLLWSGPKVGFIVANYMRIGGTETFHRTLIPRLRHRLNIVGFAVTVKMFELGDPTELKVPYYSDANELADKCDVLVTWGFEDASQFVRPGVRHITVHHADTTSKESNAAAIVGDQIICVNEQVAIELGGTYIPNAIDPDRCAEQLIPPEQNVCLWLARFSPEKHPLRLLEIARRMPDWYFIMAGEGRLLDECRYKAPANVEFVGAIANPKPLFERASRFISLAEFEGFGLSVGEAMLSRVPVISTPTGITDRDNATLVQLQQSDADWESAIRDPRSTTGHAYQFAKAFSVERMVDAWEAVLNTRLSPVGLRTQP